MLDKYITIFYCILQSSSSRSSRRSSLEQTGEINGSHSTKPALVCSAEVNFKLFTMIRDFCITILRAVYKLIKIYQTMFNLDQYLSNFKNEIVRKDWIVLVILNFFFFLNSKKNSFYVVFFFLPEKSR